MSTIFLESTTNSNRWTPDGASFDSSELNDIISKYSDAVNWSANPLIKSIDVTDDIECDFENEDDEENYWEHALTKVSLDSVMVIFTHAHDGSELYFRYSVSN